MKELITLISLACIFSSCSYINHYLGIADDNIVEEIAEDVIKGRIGVDIDLTPSTPEKK